MNKSKLPSVEFIYTNQNLSSIESSENFHSVG